MLRCSCKTVAECALVATDLYWKDNPMNQKLRAFSCRVRRTIRKLKTYPIMTRLRAKRGKRSLVHLPWTLALHLQVRRSQDTPMKGADTVCENVLNDNKKRKQASPEGHDQTTRFPVRSYKKLALLLVNAGKPFLFLIQASRPRVQSKDIILSELLRIAHQKRKRSKTVKP